MGYAIVAGLCAGGLFFAMLLMVEVGRRRRRGARGAELGAPGAEPGVGVVDGAVFALLGLLLAFTFSGAVSRFDDRRRLIVEEANAIGTAYLRVDLLPAPAQPALRDAFRRYVDSRLDAYRAFPDVDAVRAKLAASALLQTDIWVRP